jgi:hypothetical protein
MRNRGIGMVATLLGYILLLLAAVPFTGCATLPEDYPRDRSTAFED